MEFTPFLLAFALVGVATGFVGGMFGLSGGVIAVPCLAFLFRLMGGEHEGLMQISIGTSLAAMTFNSLASMIAHHRQKGIEWPYVKVMLPTLIVGCFLGAYLGHKTPTALLQLLFGIFVALFALYFSTRKNPKELEIHPPPPKKSLRAAGFWIGAISNILGIGGGMLLVPILSRLGVPMRTSVATSTAGGFIITLFGALGYLLFTPDTVFYRDTLGYVYIPGFIALALPSMIAAPFGARLTGRVEAKVLKRYFTILLLFIGVVMILKR